MFIVFVSILSKLFGKKRKSKTALNVNSGLDLFLFKKRPIILRYKYFARSLDGSFLDKRPIITAKGYGGRGAG